jgi:hypothetical protein
VSAWVAQRAGWEVLPIVDAPVTAISAGARCPKCGGDGWEIEPECCGNTTPSGECRGDCAVPVQVPCSACGGSGEVPEEQTELPL